VVRHARHHDVACAHSRCPGDRFGPLGFGHMAG
jgi:hypothetical protein